jgi:hypothetical protein
MESAFSRIDYCTNFYGFLRNGVLVELLTYFPSPGELMVFLKREKTRCIKCNENMENEMERMNERKELEALLERITHPLRVFLLLLQKLELCRESSKWELKNAMVDADGYKWVFSFFRAYEKISAESECWSGRNDRSVGGCDADGNNVSDRTCRFENKCYGSTRRKNEHRGSTIQLPMEITAKNVAKMATIQLAEIISHTHRGFVFPQKMMCSVIAVLVWTGEGEREGEGEGEADREEVKAASRDEDNKNKNLLSLIPVLMRTGEKEMKRIAGDRVSNKDKRLFSFNTIPNPFVRFRLDCRLEAFKSLMYAIITPPQPLTVPLQHTSVSSRGISLFFLFLSFLFLSFFLACICLLC